MLLEAGADPAVRNRFGDTALHVAARLGHGKLVGALLDWKGVFARASVCVCVCMCVCVCVCVCVRFHTSSEKLRAQESIQVPQTASGRPRGR